MCFVYTRQTVYQIPVMGDAVLKRVLCHLKFHRAGLYFIPDTSRMFSNISQLFFTVVKEYFENALICFLSKSDMKRFKDILVKFTCSYKIF